VVSLVASRLSAVARARTDEALGRRNELARLFDLSRDVLMVTESREALAALARAISRRFDREFVAMAVRDSARTRIYWRLPRKIIVNVRAVRDPYVQDPGRACTVTVEEEQMPVARHSGRWLQPG
jgi:hypothetical protein